MLDRRELSQPPAFARSGMACGVLSETRKAKRPFRIGLMKLLIERNTDMVASARKGARRATQTSRQGPPMDNDAIDALSEDHRKVEELFEDYESTKDEADDDAKAELVAKICLELTIHATVEEEIFYPAVRAALDEEGSDMLDEAEVEHTSIKVLIADLGDMQPSDALYDAKVKVLSEYVKHHVQEEEGEIFPSVRESEVDLAALGEEIATRKQELVGEYQQAD